MIAGSIALLEEPTDEPLESAGGDGFTTLDVRETQDAFDGVAIQSGRACSRVEGQTEDITILNDETIEVEEIASRDRVWTEWVADVTGAGFVASARTAGSDPAFPFGMFRAICGTRVDPVEIDTAAFLEAQRDADRDPDIWFSGSTAETADPDRPNDGAMQYGQSATQAGGNVGVGFHLPWRSTTVKGVVYASGYVAIYDDTWGPVQFARFVRSEILPHAEVPDEATEQSELPGGEDDAAECDRCERETELVDYEGGQYCPVCINAFEDDDSEAAP